MGHCGTLLPELILVLDFISLFGLDIHKHVRESTLSAKRIRETKQTTTSGKEDKGRKGGKQDNEGKTTKHTKGLEME